MVRKTCSLGDNRFTKIRFSLNRSDDVDDDNEEEWEDECVPTNECIFCGRAKRRCNRNIQHTSRTNNDTKISRIRDILLIENATDKIGCMENAAFINYHPSCLSQREHKLFYTNEKILGKKASDIWSLRREIHEKSFARVKNFVEMKIIEEKRVHNFAEIYDLYSSVIQEENVQRRLNLDHTLYARHHLLKKNIETLPGSD